LKGRQFNTITNTNINNTNATNDNNNDNNDYAKQAVYNKIFLTS